MKSIIGGEYKLSQDLLKISNDKPSQRYHASGRAALFKIMDAVRKSVGVEMPVICVPDYICKSVVETLVDSNSKLIFYHVNETLLPSDDFFRLIQEADAVLIVNYFGLMEINNLITNIREKNCNIRIIVDDVMNYYGFGNYEGYDYAFTSFRKWFAVPDGAEIKSNILEGETILPTLTENNFYKYKMAGNILKNYRELVGDDICLSLLQKGEELMDKEYIASSSKYTGYLMARIDKTAFAERRKDNAKILHEGLNALGINHIYRQDAIPMFIPIFLKERRDAVRKSLFDNNIFCPIHWPADWQKKEMDINPLYKWELSLICDQRYGEKEMLQQLEILKDAI